MEVITMDINYGLETDFQINVAELSTFSKIKAIKRHEIKIEKNKI